MSLDEGTFWKEPEVVTQTGEQDERWFELSRLADGTAYENGMVVRSAKFRRVLDTVKKLSGYKTTVLIQGESGTGKELVARALHDLSPVAARPFVVFNCSNLVEHLAEAQLFGHVWISGWSPRPIVTFSRWSMQAHFATTCTTGSIRYRSSCHPCANGAER